MRTFFSASHPIGRTDARLGTRNVKGDEVDDFITLDIPVIAALAARCQPPLDPSPPDNVLVPPIGSPVIFGN